MINVCCGLGEISEQSGSFLNNPRVSVNLDHPVQMQLDSAKDSLDLRRNDGHISHKLIDL